MRRVINGRRWDTEKANLICEVVNGLPHYMDYVNAGLYQTPRSKRFFLAGKGGPMSVFAYYDGGKICCGGEKLIPLSEGVAWCYAKLYADAETVKKFFEEA